MIKTIYTSECGYYRIVQITDSYYEINDLKGDCYKPSVNPEIPLEQLKTEERAFEKLVEKEGVYGYALEYWDSKPDQGWTNIDSCFGFIGEYNPNIEQFNHHIVEELKSQILTKTSKVI